MNPATMQVQNVPNGKCFSHPNGVIMQKIQTLGGCNAIVCATGLGATLADTLEVIPHLNATINL